MTTSGTASGDNHESNRPRATVAQQQAYLRNWRPPDHNLKTQRLDMTHKIDLIIKHDYLNPFASADNPRLSPVLTDYLSASAWYHPELSLQISCPQDQRERLQQAIGNTFAEKSAKLRGDMSTLKRTGLMLLVLAFALVLAATALGIEGTISAGVVTIIAWMLVWRTAEIFILDIRSAQRELRKYQRIASASKHFASASASGAGCPGLRNVAA
jgi:hypothetical protein